MANRHYGEIGDIWKHLPLAEMLSMEKPKYYAESHAGSARYALTPSWERDYGAYYFFKHAEESPVLKRSAYYRILKQHAQKGQLSEYPGSPMIAMTLLKTTARKFLFCDTDLDSLEDISVAVAELGLPEKAVETLLGDGVSALERFFSNVSSFNAAEMFAFIDPYDPLERSANGMTAAELFYYLTWRGVKTVLWYGYDRFDQRESLFRAIQRPFLAGDYDFSDGRLWCGDVHLAQIELPDFDIQPGVRGCGILCSNLSETALPAAEGLGQALARIYQSAVFPNGRSGTLVYTSPAIWPVPLSAGAGTPDDLW